MSAQFHAENFISTLTCPVGLDPLTRAVNLYPCCHKVNQVVAERIYGDSINGFCRLREPCVVCKVPVQGWAQDHTIRDLASQVFGYEKDLESLPTHSLVLEQREEQKEEVSIPYPGIPAVFVWRSGDWNSLGHNRAYTPICRMINLKSLTQDSLLQEVSLYGHYDGTVSLCIGYAEENFPKIAEYLRAHQLILDFVMDRIGYHANTPEAMKTVFRILAENNEIPDEQFAQIREVVERGACDPIERPRPTEAEVWRGVGDFDSLAWT